ncbi:hypothetical protein QQ008_28215 [Fulvivirgaceae bacterium BMA10]|uniref:Outer membrane protein beta-barrel domain-containing protein n=1 Tax=Splendidivirga corallicola TaxID=3051826 RepID=A0ABT8KX18_9BACT|nr:hypothetical protein [Fulvivirgaceae bacterium BMA10]
MKRSLTFLLVFFLSCAAWAQNSEDPQKRFLVGPVLKLVPHHETSTGILIGLMGNKVLVNKKYELGLSVMRNINTMSSTKREGYEFQSFYHVSFGIAMDLLSCNERFGIHPKSAIGFGLINEYSGINSDNRSIGSNGFFSIEPGINISIRPVQKLRIFSGISYIFNTNSAEEVDFRKPIFDFGIQFNY